MALGDAFINVDADTDPFQRAINTDVPRIAHEADSLMDTIGESWGKHLSDGSKTELRKRMPEFVKEFENGAKSIRIRIGGENFAFTRSGSLRTVAGRFTAMFQEESERAFSRLSAPGGPFSRIGEGISDAIGAGFNISGKSPLITLLVPAIGAIAGAIAALVQTANALVAVLVQVPALLVAIGIQAGILMLAFKNVGTAISGAFAAKNAEELNAALAPLTASAQNFVRSLLPLKALFENIRGIAQENFFAGLGDVVTKIANALGPVFTRQNFADLARALGGLFRDIGLFFASPTFVDFVHDVIPATTAWLGKFGPGFVSFMTAIVKMADAALPALTRLGDIVGSAFGIFTSWLNEQTQSGNLTKWLAEMGDTLENVIDLFFAASMFVASFLEALSQNGGDDTIKQFAELFAQLAMFFSSPQGAAAMAGFIHLVELLTYAFSGMIFTVLGVLVAFESMLQFLNLLGTAFVAFISWLVDTAAPAIGTFFTETIPTFLNDLWLDFIAWFDGVIQGFNDFWQGIVDGAQKKWNDLVEFVKSIPGRILAAIGDLGRILLDAGRAVMQGLRDGLQWGYDHTVKPILDFITNNIPSWKGPKAKDLALLQPAGRAVMTGFGAGLAQGATRVRSMLSDFTGDLGGLAFQGGLFNQNNTFNSNLNFFGQQPTESQAKAAGRAVGGELNDQVADRDIRLAVRMA